MDLHKYKDFMAPRYTLAGLGVVLLLLGLTGGGEIAGVDLTIENPVMGYAALALGVIASFASYRAWRRFQRETPEID